MLLPSARLLRRRTPYVVKYLEGVPVPTKLIDHLAGADLSSSSAVDFFTTVPRYVNTTQEQRLSRLFFHHVLYGAGGARGPSQVVVVRHGRHVVPSTVLHLSAHHTNTCNGRVKGDEENMKDIARQVGNEKAARSSDPMAVPLSQRGACSPASTYSSSPSPSPSHTMRYEASTLSEAAMVHTAQDAAWSRVDAARRPYFYVPRLDSARSAAQTGNSLAEVCAGRYTMASPRTSTWHAPHTTLRKPSFANVVQTEQVRGAQEGEEGGSMNETQYALQASREHTVSSDICHPPRHRESGARPTQDSALTALCGVIQGAYADLSTCESSELLAQLAVNRSAGLLHWPLHTNTTTTTIASYTGENEQTCTAVQDVLRYAAQHARTTRTHVYLQTHLPPAAITRMPLQTDHATATTQFSNNNNKKEYVKSEAEWLCRLAGGVEPRVTFAVGSPLTNSSLGQHAAPFAHITCLVRVNLHTNRPPTAQGSPHDGLQPSVREGRRAVCKAPPCESSNGNPYDEVTEPWRLGDALDPALPTRTRTLVERTSTTGKDVKAKDIPQTVNTADAKDEQTRNTVCDPLLLGRPDAETYLLPQRELLVTVYVPAATRRRVAEQNAERVRRQTRVSHQSRALPYDGNDDDTTHTLTSDDVAWPCDERLNAERTWHGQLSNLRAAEGTSTRQGTSKERKEAEAAEDGSHAMSDQHYEIRALPGDVLYIPRGWGYRVRRIVGTALLEPSNRRTTGGEGGRTGVQQEAEEENVRRVCANTTLSLDGSASHVDRSNASHTLPVSSAQTRTKKEDREYTVGEVEVDALCVMYRPYPLLTKDQARVYVAANYVQGGIEPFYRNGGNDVYYAYE